MKKPLFNLATLLFCVGSFGFWELEGPFIQEAVYDLESKKYQVLNKENELLEPINRLDVTQKEEMYNASYNKFSAEILVYFQDDVVNKQGYICLYNRQTGYSIGCMFVEACKNIFEESRLFCLSGQRIREEYRNMNGRGDFNLMRYGSGFYFVQEDPALDLDGSLNPIFGSQLYTQIQKSIMYDKEWPKIKFSPDKNENHKTRDNSIDFTNIDKKCQILKPINKKTISSSGIVITNKKEDKVEIKQILDQEPCHMGFFNRKSKTLDFQVQLVKCFNKDRKNIEFAENLKNSLLTGEGLSERKLNALKFVSRVGKGEIKRLNNSKILAVYGLMKNDRGQEGVIWGLAEDKESHRRFHWITDLEDDISVLLKQ